MKGWRAVGQSENTIYTKKISGQCRRKAIWILKLFMRKPAVRQIKKEKYYKNIKKLLLFHHVSNIILIV